MANEKRNSLKKFFKGFLGASKDIVSQTSLGSAVGLGVQKTMEAKYGVGKSKRQRQQIQEKFAEKAYKYVPASIAGQESYNTIADIVKKYAKNDQYKEAKDYVGNQLRKLRKQVENEPDAVKAGIDNRIRQFNRWEDL